MIHSKKHCGLIKWIGHIPEMNCEMAGIELVSNFKIIKDEMFNFASEKIFLIM